MIKRNIKKYRLLNGLTFRDLAKKLSVSHQTIKKYEDGDLVPNSTRLIQLAKIFKVKISDLVNDFHAPQLEFKNFRKNKSTKRKDKGLKLLISDEIGKYLEILDRANESKTIDKNKWHFYVETKEDVKKTTKEVRKLLGLSNNIPLDNLTDKLEDHNFLIIRIDYEEKFDGFSEMIDDMAFIILSTKGYERNRFTLAHELGHLILEFPENFTFDEQEKFCNYFASNLLLPEEAMKLEFGNKRKNISFFEILLIAKEYKVSLQAVIMRLHELGFINDAKKRNLFIELSKMGLNNEQLQFVDEQPKRRKKLIYKLEAEKIITREEAIKYLGVTANEYFRQEFSD